MPTPKPKRNNLEWVEARKLSTRVVQLESSVGLGYKAVNAVKYDFGVQYPTDELRAIWRIATAPAKSKVEGCDGV